MRPTSASRLPARSASVPAAAASLAAAPISAQAGPGPARPAVPATPLPASRSAPSPRASSLIPAAAAEAASTASTGGTGRLRAVKLAGTGSSTPASSIHNDDFAAMGVDTTDEWIYARTGIHRRHVLDKGESLVDHATAAASAALSAAGVDPADVGVVLLATSSPDDLFGSGPVLAAAVGASRAVAFDLTAACSGFVLGLITGAQFIRAGGARHVLVVGADALSRYVDWRDRATCILFGDGAGAVVLSAADVDDGPSTSAPSGAPCGLLGFAMASDGVGAKHLNARFAGEGGKALTPDAATAGSAGAYANIAMNGQEVFKFAVRAVPTVVEAALADAGLPGPQAIDWLVLHQANQRILDAASSRLGVPPERVVSNLAEYGNTSAASIPLALDEAVRDGRIKAGDVVAVAGFGAGLTWASAIFRSRTTSLMSDGVENVDANPRGGRAAAAAAAAAANPALSAGLVDLIQARLGGLVGQPSGFLDDLPRAVRARVAHLQDLQSQYDDLEAAYRKEADELERKYERLYAPLYAARADVVAGRADAPADVLAKTPKGEGEDEDGGEPPKGVPRFWLGVLQAHDMVANAITEKDEAVLEHLIDVSAAEVRAPPEEGEDGEGECAGFKLTFTFEPNPFFDGTVLTKTYHMSTEEEGMLEGAEGCAIAWKPGKDPTHKLMKKKVKPGSKGGRGGGAGGAVQTKKEKVPSFFDFFSPPAVPDDGDDLEEEEMEALQEALEEDYELGEAIRDELIPRAVSYFTGEMAEEDEDDDEEEDDEDDYDDDDDDESEDESDDDDDDSSDDGGGAPGKRAGGGGGKARPGGGAGGRAGGGAKGPPADTGEKPAECQQQ